MDVNMLKHPFLFYPLPPVNYQGSMFSVYCEGEDEAVKAAIPKPCEYVSNRFIVYVAKWDRCPPIRPYDEAGVVLQVKVGSVVGAAPYLQYVTTDECLCLSRELWGYPKKLAEMIELTLKNGEVTGSIKRLDVKFVSMKMKTSKEAFEPPIPSTPRILVKIIPRGAGGPGVDLMRVYAVEWKNMVFHEQKFGEASISFKPSEEDPAYKLKPTKMLGGIYAKVSFILDYGEEIYRKSRR